MDTEDTKVISFKHSGDGGDIIASLPTVKAICEKEKAKARFIMDASGGYSDEYVKAMNENGNKFNLKMAEFLKPLVEAQDYIHSVEIDTYGIQQAEYNLNKFRREFGNNETIKQTKQNLMYLHQVAFGLPVGYSGDWLNVKVDKEPQGVLIARSTRYQSAHLAWEFLIAKMNHDETPYSFCGTDLEFSAFQDCFRNARPQRKIVKDALEMAQAIGEADTVICNGTLFYWIAVGLGHPQIMHEMANNILTTHFHETKSYKGKELPKVKYMVGGCFVK